MGHHSHSTASGAWERCSRCGRIPVFSAQGVWRSASERLADAVDLAARWRRRGYGAGRRMLRTANAGDDDSDEILRITGVPFIRDRQLMHPGVLV